MAIVATKGSMMSDMVWTPELFAALEEVGPSSILRLGPDGTCAQEMRDRCTEHAKPLLELELPQEEQNSFLLLRDALLTHTVVCINAELPRGDLYELLLYCAECMKEQGIHPLFAFCNCAEEQLASLTTDFLEDTQYRLYCHAPTNMAMMVAPVLLEKRKQLLSFLQDQQWELQKPMKNTDDQHSWELEKKEATIRFLQTMRRKEILDFGWSWEVVRREKGVSRKAWNALRKEREMLRKQLRTLRTSWSSLVEKHEQLTCERNNLRKRGEELRQYLEHILHSRSWKITAFLRRADAWLRRIPAQRPLPIELTPKQQNYYVCAPAEEPTDVAVVIPCHNYGEYLGECIRSVLEQSVPAKEIVVVDDSSTDTTPAVAKSFEQQGVRYIRGEWSRVGKARNTGALSTQSPYLLFLDADDMLAPDYIERCLEKMEDRSIGIAYAHPIRFGERNHLSPAPKFTRDGILKRNYISSHALIRRQAFEMAGGYAEYDHPHEDWDLYKRILQTYWGAARANTHLYYRAHNKSRFYSSQRKPEWVYAQRASLHNQPVSLCTVFHERTPHIRRFVDALSSLESPPEHVQFHCMDATQDESFHRTLRKELSAVPFGSLSFHGIEHQELWRRAEALKPHTNYIRTMCTIEAISRFAKVCQTEFGLMLAADCLLPANGITALLNTVEEDAAAIAAPFRPNTETPWNIWHTDLAESMRYSSETGKGIEEIGGADLQCVLFRMSALRKSLPSLQSGSQPLAHLLFQHLRTYGGILCNWDIRTEPVYTASPLSS